MSRGLNLLSLQSKLKFAVEARAAPCCTHTAPDLIPGLLSLFNITTAEAGCQMVVIHQHEPGHEQES